MPPFSLQKVAFYIAIDGLLQRHLPSFTTPHILQCTSSSLPSGGLGWVLGGLGVGLLVCVALFQPVIFPKTLCRIHANTIDTAIITRAVRQ